VHFHAHECNPHIGYDMNQGANEQCKELWYTLNYSSCDNYRNGW